MGRGFIYGIHFSSGFVHVHNEFNVIKETTLDFGKYRQIHDVVALFE
ncbi:MAG: hypothetical protein HXS48_06650 [Theionarchaea archaeon]|nr:hypothetical protein [Theionarchaea archaeon]